VRHVVQCTFNGRRIVIFSGGAAQSDETTMKSALSTRRWVWFNYRAQLVPAPQPEAPLLNNIIELMAENVLLVPPLYSLRALQRAVGHSRRLWLVLRSPAAPLAGIRQSKQLLVSCVLPMPEFSIESESLPGGRGC